MEWLSGSVDTAPRGGMLTVHVYGAIGQFGGALVRERATAGRVEARRQGRKGGSPSAMRPSDVAAARAMMKEGTLPVRDIAKRMGVSVATQIGRASSRERVCQYVLILMVAVSSQQQSNHLYLHNPQFISIYNKIITAHIQI